jgi:hypothetical protein
MKNRRTVWAIVLAAFIALSLTVCNNEPSPEPTPEPTPDLPGTITISPNGTVEGNTELTAVYSGSETVSYQWKMGENNVGTNSDKYTPTELGTCTVTVSAEGYNPKTSDPVTIGPYWTAVTDSAFGSSTINAIAWGNNKFVAVGYGAKMAYSADGVTWTPVTDSTFTIYIFPIAYGNNKFVAVGYGGTMAYSADGVTWTDELWAGRVFTAIAWGNSKFVAGEGASSGKMATSTDGVTWTAGTDSTFGTSRIQSIAWGNGKFVAGGEDGKMAYSADGVTWTAVDTGTLFDYVNSSGTTVKAAINAIAYGNGKFVAVGSSGKMAYSADGETWTAVSDSTFGTSPIQSIAWGNSKFVAGGDYGKMATSTDGVTWTAENTGTLFDYVDSYVTTRKATIYAIAWGNNKFVAGGSSGKMAYSTGY